MAVPSLIVIDGATCNWAVDDPPMGILTISLDWLELEDWAAAKAARAVRAMTLMEYIVVDVFV